MSASACLRILLDIGEAKIARLDAMGPLVARVAGAFLVVRWPTPKRYSVLTPYCFLLTDPDAEVLDASTLTLMAAELKNKLFGDAPCGDVTVLLHEGDEEETARFAAMEHATLKHLLEIGQGSSTFGGRLRMMSTANHLDALEGGATEWKPIKLVKSSGAAPRGPWTAAFQPVYYALGQSIAGSGVAATAPGSSFPNSVFDVPGALPNEDSIIDFDMACLGAASERLESGDGGDGVLYVPIAFSSVTRAAAREAYMAAFKILPSGRRAQLAAVLYGTPRIPPPRAVAEIRPMLGPHFAYVEIQIDDPGFDIEQFPNGVLHSVSLRLPKAEAYLRAQAVRRFLANETACVRKGVRLGLTNVRDRDELKSCLVKAVSYVSGPAVGGLMAAPAATGAVPYRNLPVTELAAA